MAETDKKRRMREETRQRKDVSGKKRKQFQSKTLTLEKQKRKKKHYNSNDKKKDERRKTGPRLPSALKRELDHLNSDLRSTSDEDLDNDVYEYEERMPEEDSKKNRRFDPVDNLEYKLPDEFQDENLPSEDDDEDDYEDNDSGEKSRGKDNSNQLDGEVEEDDEGRHARMLQGITGIPSEAFEGKKKRKYTVLSEAHPESEYNPSRGAIDGDGNISFEDLLESIQGMSGYSKVRKRVHRVDRKSMSVLAPLPKADRERLERKVVYEQSKKEITKWEPLVKKHREAPTLYFDEDTNIGFSTVGAIASEFEPKSDFEKKIASLVQDPKVMEAHNKDGSRLLELNKISVEDVKDRQNRLAKMRSLLFRHEMKAKHIRKIKSKAYHRLLKKDRLKTASARMEMDPEAVKEQAMKQEFKRAEERMTLKHKNSSKWAKRILKRGLDTQDEGTRAAISEQLHQHALLSRKMNSVKDSSSDESSSDEEDGNELLLGSDQDKASKLLTKVKEKTLELMEDAEQPKSGVLSMPFMVNADKKRKAAAYREAELALRECESMVEQLDDTSGAENPKTGSSSGRRVFGAARKVTQELSSKKSNNFGDNSDSEDDLEAIENIEGGQDNSGLIQKDVQIDPGSLYEESGVGLQPVFKSFDDIVKDPGHKTTFEVSIFASESWRKMKKVEVDGNNGKSSTVVEPGLPRQELKEVDVNTDSETEEEMVDGILSSGAKSCYELPSQADLIHRAFAGDNVEEEFENNKLEILKEENPEPEKPVLLPGWGQWTHIQQKKGLPSWMLEEHESAKKKREEALKKRKDAHLKHVIISEKIDKKAEKLHTKTLPYPYTSKEVFEQSIRMPIGPEFNPATSVGALIRPEVVKKPGIIIKPIKYKEVNTYEKAEEHKKSGWASKTKGNKSWGEKTTKMQLKKKS